MRRSKFINPSLYGCIVLMLLLDCCFLQAQPQQSNLMALRDSLDAITIPIPQYHQYPRGTVVRVKNQNDWEKAGATIEKLLEQGYKNITVEIAAKTLYLGIKTDSLYNLKYPEANIRIVGNGVKMLPEGVVFSKKDKRRVKGTSHYTFLSHCFSTSPSSRIPLWL